MSAPRLLRALRPLLLAAAIALSVSRAADASAADRASKIADRLVKQLDDEELALVWLAHRRMRSARRELRAVDHDGG